MELEGGTADSVLKCLRGTELKMSPYEHRRGFLCVGLRVSAKTFNSHEMLKFSFCPL